MRTCPCSRASAPFTCVGTVAEAERQPPDTPPSVTLVSRPSLSLDRRLFLATAGSGAALAAASVVAAPPSKSAHADTPTGPVDVITVEGAIPGIPYRTRTAILDVAEYSRRAQVNSDAFTNAWKRALQRLAEVPAPADSPAIVTFLASPPNAPILLWTQ